jgi:hypothetical protein
MSDFPPHPIGNVPHYTVCTYGVSCRGAIWFVGIYDLFVLFVQRPSNVVAVQITPHIIGPNCNFDVGWFLTSLLVDVCFKKAPSILVSSVASQSIRVSFHPIVPHVTTKHSLKAIEVIWPVLSLDVRDLKDHAYLMPKQQSNR